MIRVDVEQGSPEWFAVRCGVPTASNFDKIVTSTGAPSKQAQKYLYQLAAERVTGRSEEGFKSQAMDRGRETEAEARSLYELINDVTVEPVGFCFKDEKRLFGASPDGLVGEDGLLEIKCPLAFASVGYILDNKLPTDYVQQVQGQLYVTGRKWLDFLSYYPGLKPMIVRVIRDEAFIKALEPQILSFCDQLNQIAEKIK